MNNSYSRDKAGNLAYLIHEDRPQYDLWLKLIVGGTIALTLVLGIVFLFVDLVGAWVMFGTTAFDALLFNAIMPRSYQIFQDRLRIVIGKPFAFTIPLDTIKEVRPASSSETFIFWGIKFATSASNVAEIVRNKGMNVIISPANCDAFLGQVNQALKTMRDSK